ncbi:MAG: glycerophosphoryl diester phosphodiesterase membrane domain-containing protein [Solirubrobacteraceae bacterium]|nr:glycerophosphoryl diester phosphodiesterase membrane domain-containing protein [Solirubrobacteraceae bacterium]
MTTTTEGVRPRLRALSLGEILDVSIKICLAHWRTLIMAVLVVVVPVQIITTILTADYTVSSFDLSADSSQTPEETLDELNQYIGGIALSGLLQVCAVLLATAACFRAIAQAYLGESADWRSSLSYALKHAPSLLLLTLLYVLGVLLGTLLFILPGIWLYVAWAFALPALLVEGVRGRGALGRSFTLVKGRWWRTLGVLVVGFILAGIVSTLVQGVFLVGAFLGDDNDAVVLLLSGIAGVIGLAITTPFQAALITVVYFDLRVRKEGFDLELLAQEIGAGAPGSATGTAPAAAVAPPAALPASADIDRTGAPFWPPPPGWQPPPPPPPGWPPPSPPAAEGPAGSGERDADSDSDPPRLPGVPGG